MMVSVSCVPIITDLVEGIHPFYPSSSSSSSSSSSKPSDDEASQVLPALMIVLSSGRKAFFEEVYGTAEFNPDALEAYGPSLEPMRYEGKHFEVVTRCISNREPSFIEAAESFLN